MTDADYVCPECDAPAVVVAGHWTCTECAASSREDGR